MTPLTLVDEEYANRPRTLVLATRADDLDTAAAHLTATGHTVVNEDSDGDLRTLLGQLTACSAVALPVDWWTSVTAHQIVTVASWLHLKFVDHTGAALPTLSLQGAHR